MTAKHRAVLGVPPPEKKHTPTSNAVGISPVSAGMVSVTFFASRVAPILHDKCFQCHGPQKKKGKLRLDTFENVMRGGKDGVIVKPGDPSGSEIFRRITLPRLSLRRHGVLIAAGQSHFAQQHSAPRRPGRTTG